MKVCSFAIAAMAGVVSATFDPSMEIPVHHVDEQSVPYQYLFYVNQYQKNYKTMGEFK